MPCETGASAGWQGPRRSRRCAAPGMGTARPEVDLTLRLFPVGNYLIFYRHTEFDVEIVRVLHGARNWQTLL